MCKIIRTTSITSFVADEKVVEIEVRVLVFGHFLELLSLHVLQPDQSLRLDFLFENVQEQLSRLHGLVHGPAVVELDGALLGGAEVGDVDVQAVELGLGDLDVDLSEKLVSECALIGRGEELACEWPDVLPDEGVLVLEENFAEAIDLEPAAVLEVRELVVVSDGASDALLVTVDAEVLEGEDFENGLEEMDFRVLARVDARLARQLNAPVVLGC